jgi:hypothetical protein
MNNGSNVNVILLDASRAFDRVNYVKLFVLLKKRKLCPMITRFLIKMYTSQSIRVKWGTSISAMCSVSNGVKQGGVLSPILFTIYFDEMLQVLKLSQLGCHIGHTFCGAIGYADDVILLAPSFCGLNKMLDICKKFADSYDVLFNSSKSKLLTFQCSNSIMDVKPIVFMDQPIELVTSEKHLGNIFGQNINEQKIQDSTYQFIGKTNMVISHFSHVPFDIRYYIF